MQKPLMTPALTPHERLIGLESRRQAIDLIRNWHDSRSHNVPATGHKIADMKRLAFAVAVAVLLALAACSSSNPASTGPKAKIPEPVFNVDQLVGPADQNYPEGDFEVKLRLGIRNNSLVPMTLRRVSVRTANPAGGAYTLNPRAYYFNKTVPPNGEINVDFWARGYCWGRGSREAEPVTITGTAYFQTPSGSYDMPFMRELSQYR